MEETETSSSEEEITENDNINEESVTNEEVIEESTIAASRGENRTALDRAKEASAKERSLIR